MSPVKRRYALATAFPALLPLVASAPRLYRHRAELIAALPEFGLLIAWVAASVLGMALIGGLAAAVWTALRPKAYQI